MGREVGNVVQALRIWKGCRAMLLKNVNLSATKLVISGSTNKRMRVGYREKKTSVLFTLRALRFILIIGLL